MEFALLVDHLFDMNEVFLLRRWARCDIIASAALTDSRPSVGVYCSSCYGQIIQERFIVTAI